MARLESPAHSRQEELIWVLKGILGYCSPGGVWVIGLAKTTGGSPLCAPFCSPSGDLYTQAAEAAMEAMKGRLANQYYQKAEEAWAQMEE